MIAILAAAAVVSGATNLLVNGSFEQPPTAYFSTYTAGSPQLRGWTITAGSIDVIGPNWHPYSGKQSLDLDGTPGPGAIAQTFNTTRGKRYLLRFALAANAECAPAVKRLRVDVGGVTRRYTFNAAHTSDGAMGWILERIPFVARGARTTLRFTSLDPAGSNCGPALDAVSVTANR